jgi:hypothetical protein
VREMRAGPSGVGGQTQASNYRKVLRSKAVVLSVAEKAGWTRQVRFGKASASKPLMTCRKRSDDVETGDKPRFRDEVGGWSDCCPTGIRHGGSASPNQAQAWNVRTSAVMAREKSKQADPARASVPMRGARGGAIRSSGESAVMALERRDCVVQLFEEANRQREELRG